MSIWDQKEAACCVPVWGRKRWFFLGKNIQFHRFLGVGGQGIVAAAKNR
jgi:hypothetical protein